MTNIIDTIKSKHQLINSSFKRVKSEKRVKLRIIITIEEISILKSNHQKYIFKID